jgi:hypothetical protein
VGATSAEPDGVVDIDAGAYVAEISSDIPAQDSFEVAAYDAEGEEMARFGPADADYEEFPHRVPNGR